MFASVITSETFYAAMSISQSRICFSLHNSCDLSWAAEDTLWKEGWGTTFCNFTTDNVTLCGP